MALAGISANRLELLQIADAVAREKSIDRKIVIAGDGGRDPEGREVALRRRERHPLRDRSRRPARRKLTRVLAVVEAVENEFDADHARRRQAPQPRSQGRRPDRRAAAALRFRPRAGAERQAGHRAEGARGRARAPATASTRTASARSSTARSSASSTATSSSTSAAPRASSAATR